MSGGPACTVVVPSYQSQGTIGACLRSLRRQDLARPFEVIVVDSSSDQSPELVAREFPEARLVHRAERTPAPAARNLGAAAAASDTLAFLDSDCVAPADWLRRLRLLLDAGYDGVGGAISNANGQSLVSWAGYFCEFREFLPRGEARDVDNLTLGNAAYRREPFLAVGGLPEDCFPQEDQVFHDALRRRGGRLRLDPGIVVAHHHRDERGAFLDHQRRVGRANALVLRRIERPGSFLARRPILARLVVPLLVPYRLARTVAACRDVEDGALWRRPALLALVAQGMVAWGRGFAEGAAGRG